MSDNKYQPHIFLLKTITNLHVGGGESSYEVVDNQVQRDPATKRPTIYSSSLKGALRDMWVEKEMKHTVEIFGSEPGDDNAIQGAFRFLNADLLAIPKPVTEVNNTTSSYEVVYADKELDEFLEKIQLLDEQVLNKAKLIVKIEAKIKGDLIPDAPGFHEASSELPVIARNQLDNGVSQNLWYEEVVPRFSFFAFVIMAQDKVATKAFNQFIKDEKVIQIGANATIGYGLCEIEKIN